MSIIRTARSRKWAICPMISVRLTIPNIPCPITDVYKRQKLAFVPGVMRNLAFIRQKLDYEFVMVSNQDGLGTDAFPEDTFWPVHNLMMRTLEGEGVTFDDVLIDRSFPEENLPTRKPDVYKRQVQAPVWLLVRSVIPPVSQRFGNLYPITYHGRFLGKSTYFVRNA